MLLRGRLLSPPRSLSCQVISFHKTQNQRKKGSLSFTPLPIYIYIFIYMSTKEGRKKQTKEAKEGTVERWLLCRYSRLIRNSRFQSVLFLLLLSSIGFLVLLLAYIFEDVKAVSSSELGVGFCVACDSDSSCLLVASFRIWLLELSPRLEAPLISMLSLKRSTRSFSGCVIYSHFLRNSPRFCVWMSRKWRKMELRTVVRFGLTSSILFYASLALVLDYVNDI